MLAGFMKYLPSARMDCIVPRFTVSCSRCAASRALLWFSWLSSDSVKCKGASCVQSIKYAAQNRQKWKSPVLRSIRSTGLSYVVDFWLHSHRRFSCHALCKIVSEQIFERNEITETFFGILIFCNSDITDILLWEHKFQIIPLCLLCPIRPQVEILFSHIWTCAQLGYKWN